MKKSHLTVFFTLLLITTFQLNAQTNADTASEIEKLNFPQWAKDLRRFDIIAFGSFPFSLFAATFFTDLYRWNQANRFDFSEAGRRYAPWPLKSAGAAEMTKKEFQRTMLIAAGISLTAALVDFTIVRLKKIKEQRRIESVPPGTSVINTRPVSPDIEEETITEEAEQEDE
ncbi:MAG: hypothetical protein LBB81_01945 [Treponema sp.]|nr:hypothetical protein [Treponema sp.]